jgi:hypothetical protein
MGSNVEYLNRIPDRLSRSKIYLLNVFAKGFAWRKPHARLLPLAAPGCQPDSAGGPRKGRGAEGFA